MIERDRTLAIICGASSWPRYGYEPAAAFAKSAEEIRRYLCGEPGLGIPADNLAWLFDTPDAVAQYDQIDSFLARRLGALNAPQGKGVAVIFCYIGHGALLGQAREYCLLVTDTRRPIEAATSLRVSDLAQLLRARAPGSRRILILDCCFAGEAAHHFQSGLHQVASASAHEVVNQQGADSGVALLCASSARSPAQLDSAESWTLFGRELIRALYTGDPRVPGPLSLRNVCDLVSSGLRTTVANPPRPEVHVPDQTAGDLAAVPLFPNPALSPEAMTAAPVDPPDADALPVVTLPDRSTELKGHRKQILTVQFSPDGQLLATGSGDGTARLWDPETGRELHRLAGHGEVHTVAFHPGGAILATGDNARTVRLWDTASGTLIRVLTGHTGRIFGYVYGAAFSPDGRLLATAGHDRTIRLWNVETGEQEHVFISPPAILRSRPVHAVAFHPSGRLLASGGADKVVSVWDVEKREHLTALRPHTGSGMSTVRGIAFSPDGGFVAAVAWPDEMTLRVGSSSVRLWDLNNSWQVYTLSGQTGLTKVVAFYALAFSPIGDLIGTAGGQKLMLWDRRYGTHIATAHLARDCYAVAFHPDGRLVAVGCEDGSVHVWQLVRETG